jgi:hypothetical protein
MDGISRRQLIRAGAVVALGLAHGIPAAAAPTDVARPHPELLARALRAAERHRGHLVALDRIGIVDFSAPSHAPRFHIVDLASGASRALLVAHGRGSDPAHLGFLQRFSNDPGSGASSNGAYVTGERYIGKHGTSARLLGLDPENCNAERRAIVIHAAPYVSADQARVRGKIGRSEGCFAVAPSEIGQVLAQFERGRLIFADRIP